MTRQKFHTNVRCTIAWRLNENATSKLARFSTFMKRNEPEEGKKGGRKEGRKEGRKKTSN